jgi:hypothetical protein
MIFGEFYKISVFIEKKKNERKRKKNLHGLGPAQLAQLQGFSPG